MGANVRVFYSQHLFPYARSQLFINLFNESETLLTTVYFISYILAVILKCLKSNLNLAPYNFGV